MPLNGARSEKFPTPIEIHPVEPAGAMSTQTGGRPCRPDGTENPTL
jgi:hypothetical protein